jgi:predicted amidohydrolase
MAGDVYPHFRAAAVQAAPVFLDREATISRLADWVAKARDVGDIFLKPEHFLVLEGYDPRIHALNARWSGRGNRIEWSSKSLQPVHVCCGA